MGNSNSAVIGVEGNHRNSGKAVCEPIQKSRNDVMQQRGTSCKFNRNKVLPDLGSPLRLRRTDNGDILHNGGTISARRQVGSSSPDSYQDCEVKDEQISRRLRLFKTRNECRKTCQDDFQPFQRFSQPTSLQRSLSTPQFDGELLPGSERLKQLQPMDGGEEFTKNPSGWKVGEPVRPPSNVHNSSGLRSNSEDAFELPGHQTNEYLDSIPNQNKVITPTTKTLAPVKKFYFGMNINEDMNGSTVDNFRAKLQSNQDNFDGFISLPISDTVEVVDEEDSHGGISVQLRATLPRKQLDIPQFSPLTAWRLLSCGEAFSRGDNPGHCEEELEILSSSLNSHLHHYHHHVLLVDKSQDSGISADDSPRIDSQAAWTPQQDLEETSSEGGFPPFPAASSENCQTARFSPRFIVSLPREDRMNVYSDHVKGGYTNRRRDRLNCEERERTRNNEGSPLIDSNWVLSRSMPSLLNAATLRPQWSSVEVPFDDEDLNSSLVKQPSFSYLANGGHIMYLPQYSKYRISDKGCRSGVGNSSLSKSCEDVTTEGISKEVECSNIPQTKNDKKFTFQSTIRQLERKRLADKLSREAESKENERRIEIEAMRKAEEEFQRKREKEKVGIRQQLRLFSLSGSPTSTQILSEYHIPSRDYKEYRHKYQVDGDSPTPDISKKSTVHPAVTYQIPKSTQIYFNPRTNSDRSGAATNQALGIDNYRKKFAQGGVASSLGMNDPQPLNHFTSLDNHIRGESQMRMKGAIPLIQSNRLAEGRPTGL